MDVRRRPSRTSGISRTVGLALSLWKMPSRQQRDATTAALPPFELVVEQHGRALLRFCVAEGGAPSAPRIASRRPCSPPCARTRSCATRRGTRVAVRDRGPQGDRPAPRERACARAGRRHRDARGRRAAGPRAPALWAQVAGLPDKQRRAVPCATVATSRTARSPRSWRPARPPRGATSSRGSRVSRRRTRMRHADLTKRPPRPSSGHAKRASKPEIAALRARLRAGIPEPDDAMGPAACRPVAAARARGRPPDLAFERHDSPLGRIVVGATAEGLVRVGPGGGRGRGARGARRTRLAAHPRASREPLGEPASSSTSTSAAAAGASTCRSTGA